MFPVNQKSKGPFKETVMSETMSHAAKSGDNCDCSNTGILFFAKTALPKLTCGKAHFHGEKNTCKGEKLAF
jgi:hypothetical protein